MTERKPFNIPKALVWEAYRRVKANKGAAGIDSQSIEGFDRDRNRNLYNSARVLSPRTAAIATFALKLGEWFLLFRFVIFRSYNSQLL